MSFLLGTLTSGMFEGASSVMELQQKMLNLDESRQRIQERTDLYNAYVNRPNADSGATAPDASGNYGGGGAAPASGPPADPNAQTLTPAGYVPPADYTVPRQTSKNVDVPPDQPTPFSPVLAPNTPPEGYGSQAAPPIPQPPVKPATKTLAPPTPPPVMDPNYPGGAVPFTGTPGGGNYAANQPRVYLPPQSFQAQVTQPQQQQPQSRYVALAGANPNRTG